MKHRIMKALLAAAALTVFAGCAKFGYPPGHDEAFSPQKKNVPLPTAVFSDTTVEFGSGVTLGSLAAVENGRFADPSARLDLLEPGTHDYSYTLLDLNGRPHEQQVLLTVTDTTAPLLSVASTVYVDYGDSGYELTDSIFYGDQYTRNVEIAVEGGWNVYSEGRYPITVTATDEAGNSASASFTLVVRVPESGGESYDPPHYDFGQFAADYEREGVIAGIDVSTWQGEIDWNAVKADGVKFAILRVGFQRGYGGEYVLDDTFSVNLAGAQEVGMPIGVYFYSYATSPEEAAEQARWVVEQLGGAELALPISFDWENWGSFSGRGLSFADMDRMAAAFIAACEEHGYAGNLYSSKNYLTDVWDGTACDVWMAHYVDESSYAGRYMMWQVSCTGGVAGIDAYVDMNLLYLDYWPLDTVH